jgi:hypothetical protein
MSGRKKTYQIELTQAQQEQLQQSQTLEESPRSGRPRKFLPNVRASVTAIACTQPSQSKFGSVSYSASYSPPIIFPIRKL